MASFISLLETIQDYRTLTVGYVAQVLPSFGFGSDGPPKYTELDDWETHLPQHNLDLPFPAGWNNKLNLILMDSWLAYRSNRTYTFSDFLWPDEHYPWAKDKERHQTPRTPLNALMSGPSAGGSWSIGDPAPRAVSQRWFDVVCPTSERRLLYADEIKHEIQTASGDVILSHWQKLLSEAPERCIEVTTKSKYDPFPEVFDASLWGSMRSLSLWDDFKESPVSRLLATSPLVQSAIEDNLSLFIPRSLERLFRLIDGRRFGQNKIFEHVMTIHVRRGDFKGACLENWSRRATFYNWNLLPFLPDRLALPQNDSSGIDSEQAKVYLERCFADIPTIVKKVRKVKLDYLTLNQERDQPRSLDILYIMSNDRTEWVHTLKEELREDGWPKVIMSQDLKLDSEQKDVGMAVDMDIGRRSAVFLGNGWSSLTSNVNHRRLVEGKAPISIRFF
ncbi:hypothetical protein BJ165DRAFT_1527705 [Panaeolus papilionaceus]|nr:hypothetical protein BJ165DRAFT_1527705 [Panaeolus papilionaceus]